MKGALPILAVLLAAAAVPARAQTPPPLLVRADAAGSLGWLNANKSELDSSNGWYHHTLQGTATVGWYWTNHLKTEIEVSASAAADLYGADHRLVGGTIVDSFAEHRFSTRRVSVGQVYQFGENAWFQPHAGAGVDLNRETHRRDHRTVSIYDPQTRQTRVFQERETATDRDLHVRPFALLGFKAYMTPRTFFRSDLRIVAARRLDEVALRFGLGVDF